MIPTSSLVMIVINLVLGFAIPICLACWLVKKHNASWRTILIGAATFIVFALVQCRGQYHELIFSAFGEPAFVGGVLYLAVLSSVAAFIALNYGTVRVTVSEASIFANLTTVISIVAGVVFLHENFSLFQVIGAAIIIGSVYFANRPDKGDVL